MFEPLGTPAFLAEARKNAKWRSPVAEILIFFVVYLIAQLAQSIFLYPYLLLVLVRDPQFFRIASSGDVQSAMAYSEKIMTEVLPSDPVYYLVLLFATVATILAAVIYCRCIEKRSFFSMGLSKKAFASYPVGILVGALMFGLMLGFSLLFGAVKMGGVSSSFSLPYTLLFFLGYLVQGFAEEIFCRGYLMVTLAKRMPLKFAVIASSFAFMGLHTANPNVSALSYLNLFLFGIFMSLYVIRTGNIFGAAAIHAVWNFAEGVLTDFPVSGMKMPVSMLSVIPNEAKTWVNGGAFGPEGGLAVTFVLVFGIAVLGMVKTKNAQEK